MDSLGGPLLGGTTYSMTIDYLWYDRPPHIQNASGAYEDHCIPLRISTHTIMYLLTICERNCSHKACELVTVYTR